MTKEKRAAEFLAKAKEAEEQAAQAKSPEAKEAWARIARNYRDLAKQAGRYS
jgi:hypothetical protein